jgi:hypothetical protein
VGAKAVAVHRVLHHPPMPPLVLHLYDLPALMLLGMTFALISPRPDTNQMLHHAFWERRSVGFFPRSGRKTPEWWFILGRTTTSVPTQPLLTLANFRLLMEHFADISLASTLGQRVDSST